MSIPCFKEVGDYEKPSRGEVTALACLHLDNLLVIEGATIVDHAHAPLSIATWLRAFLGLFNTPPVVVPPLLVATLLTLEKGNPA